MSNYYSRKKVDPSQRLSSQLVLNTNHYTQQAVRNPTNHLSNFLDDREDDEDQHKNFDFSHA